MARLRQLRGSFWGGTAPSSPGSPRCRRDSKVSAASTQTAASGGGEEPEAAPSLSTGKKKKKEKWTFFSALLQLGELLAFTPVGLGLSRAERAGQRWRISCEARLFRPAPGGPTNQKLGSLGNEWPTLFQNRWPGNEQEAFDSFLEFGPI